MNALFLLIAILIPFVCGLFALRTNFKGRKQLYIYIETAAIITTVVVWIFLFTAADTSMP
ncbi:MAG: hypothetical protein HUJ73_00025, partial [Eubacterium sp.]|nr:hypothetical protein [Eubacterium sp.]